ncbi:mucin-5AC-like isoform X2 [Haliotis rubra]|uniref:mucin-5AC-like isoform X2 n=1 Tax=Haliotis rubra TaxID=36100 RepID=UPI001EE4FB54|nr:mucin-5AC-like isoform X2 [Haliotis rubra]
MGDNWRNARVSTRASTDGSSLDVHINLGQVPASALANGAQLRMTQARQMLDIAREAVNKLETPPSEQQAENMEGQDENQNREQPQTTSDSNEESDMDTSSPSGASADTASQSEAKEKRPATNSQSQGRDDAATSSQSQAREDTPAADSQSEARAGAPAADSSSNQANGQQRRDSEAPRLTSMSELLGDVMELHGRLQPHVARSRDIMAEDMELQNDQVQEPQRMFNLVSEALHAISHTYHNLSDLMVDMATPPARRMYTAPTQPLMPGIPHQGIPVRAQFSVGSPRLVRRTVTTTQPRPEASAPQDGATTTAGATSATATSTTTTTSQPNVPPGSTGSIGPLPPGFLSGTANNPYVYVEVGPDSVTVNSISTQIIGNESSSNGDRQRANGTTGTTSTSSSSSSSSSSSATTTTSTTSSGGATPSAPPPPIPGLTGMNIPGLPPDMMQNIISSVLHQHGHRQGQPVQINVVPVPMSSLGGQMPGGINITRVLNPAAMSATTTPTAPNPAAPASSTSQSSTATTTASSSAATNASTSATTTPSGTASATSAGASSTAQASATASTTTTGVPGPRLIPPMMLDGVPRPVDPYLPCNSHHFLAQRTRNMATQTSQGPENALSDMVSNLMNGLLGNVPHGPPRSAPASVAPGGPTSTHPAHGAASSRATTHTTFSQPGPIPANPFASLLQGTFGPMLGPRAPAPPTDNPGSAPVPPMMQMLRDMLQSANPQSQQPQLVSPQLAEVHLPPVPGPRCQVGSMHSHAWCRDWVT